MMFLFKKIVSPFFLPLPFCLMISFLGLLILWFTKKQRGGKILITIGMGALALLSYEPISDALLSPLEHKFDPYKAENYPQDSLLKQGGEVKYVVVLGGGHNARPDTPITGHLPDVSLKRLLEGIRIYRENPGSKLLLSGGAAFKPISEAEVARDVARFIGVDERDIILETRSKDTKDQAKLIRSMVGRDRFVLVTSALHMPRSIALFKKLGMKPIPGPAEVSSKKKGGLAPRSFFPQVKALDRSSRAIHEYLGLIWARLKGQI